MEELQDKVFPKAFSFTRVWKSGEVIHQIRLLRVKQFSNQGKATNAYEMADAHFEHATNLQVTELFIRELFYFAVNNVLILKQTPKLDVPIFLKYSCRMSLIVVFLF